MIAICTAVLVSRTLIGPLRIPTSCSHFDTSPLAASGMRQANVRMRKLVKLGTTTNANMIDFHFADTLKTKKYATGKPNTKHSVVARIEIFRVDLKTVKNVGLNALR